MERVMPLKIEAPAKQLVGLILVLHPRVALDLLES
jgi:hypothetical protein